jgi:hypothetical protein
MSKSKHFEIIFWSIAFPGFGQFLNKKILKGVTFLTLEFVINTKSNLNSIIISSFLGEIDKAINQTNYQWLMFYPCVYLFAIWDAYQDAGGGQKPYSFLPFVFSAYFGTIGVIYSKSNLGRNYGPVWFSILFIFIGLGVGLLISKALNTKNSNRYD